MAKEIPTRTGFILVQVEPSRDHEFIDVAMGFPQVKEAHLVTGTADAFLIVEGRDEHEIHEFVMRELRAVREVKVTNTFVSTSVEMMA